MALWRAASFGHEPSRGLTRSLASRTLVGRAGGGPGLTTLLLRALPRGANPGKVDARSGSSLLVESLVLSALLGTYRGRGVAGFRGPVTKFGRLVSGIRRVDQFAQPRLAAR